MADLDMHEVAFPTLDDIHVATLGKFGTRRVLRDGEHMCKAGDREYKFFVVERGAVEIVEHSTGETKRVTLHERHEFGGDVSLVTGRPALVSAMRTGGAPKSSRLLRAISGASWLSGRRSASCCCEHLCEARVARGV